MIDYDNLYLIFGRFVFTTLIILFYLKVLGLKERRLNHNTLLKYWKYLNKFEPYHSHHNIKMYNDN